MSEVKLNIIDAQHTLTGTIHGSVADSCVAALSAEPETIAELEAALVRYNQPLEGERLLACFRSSSEIDAEPWDAGLVIIDLAARIVATESTYSQPGLEGEVRYHDGTQATDISVPYQLPTDWLFVNSVDAYRWSADRRREQRERCLPLDARAVLYGPALLEFIVGSGLGQSEKTAEATKDDEASQQALAEEITGIHAKWLMTPREDLAGRPPREVLLEKQDFIDRDLDARSWQWSVLGEGPPCLAPDSFAYRFAGFGTHEWVVYYDLVRYLLWNVADLRNLPAQDDLDSGDQTVSNEILLKRLEKLKSDWLETPQDEFDGRVPAIIIDNERRRLPQAMSPAEQIIDEDCECCRMMALEAEMGFGPGFWHLDGSHMDEGFAFSSCLTIQEWETEIRRREEFDREFDERMEERRLSMAGGEIIEGPSFSDPF